MKKISWSSFYDLLDQDEIVLTEDLHVTKNTTVRGRIHSFLQLYETEYKPVSEFTGVLDGNGYTIHNLPTRLFNTVCSEGVVKNLTFTGLTNTNGVICRRNEGLISNITINDSFSQDDRSINIGSIVSKNNGIIENCTVKSSVRVQGQDCPKIGGIAGVNFGLIRDCTFNGEVSGLRSTGGITGLNYGDITNCKSSGEISGENRIGGISGVNQDTITDCTIKNLAVYTKTKYGVEFGGITGLNKGKITNCTISHSLVEGSACVGGAVGQNDSLLKNCILSTIRSTAKSSIGGIVGTSSESSTCSSLIHNGFVYSTPQSEEKGKLFGVIEQDSSVNQCFSVNDTEDSKLVGVDNRENPSGVFASTQSIDEIRSLALV